MKEVLMNLALTDLSNFCKEHHIDRSGTHILKPHRGFTYYIVRTETGRTLATVTFSKNAVPSHFIVPE